MAMYNNTKKDLFEISFIAEKSVCQKSIINRLLEKNSIAENQVIFIPYLNIDIVASIYDEPEYDYVELCISIFNQTFKRDTFETDIKVITKLVTMFFKENHSFKYALCSFETNGYILSHFKNINDMNPATLEEEFPIIYINHEPLTIIIKPQAQNLFD